jgi:hypothetical protein
VVGGELKDSGTDGTRETNWRNRETHFQLENIRRGSLGDLDLNEVLQTAW